jgi:hypothetical protein
MGEEIIASMLLVCRRNLLGRNRQGSLVFYGGVRITSFLCFLDVGCCRGDIPTAFPQMTGAGFGAIRPEF